MRISVDGGALCVNKKLKFGNYTVSENLFTALRKFDSKNKYEVYTFCSNNHDSRSSSNFRYSDLKVKKFWLKGVVSIKELFSDNNLFLAVNQAIPVYVKEEIISFSHGLAYLFYPHLYPDSHNKMKRQLKGMLKKSKYIILPSIKIKKEIVSTKYYNDAKLKVIPYGIPFDMSLSLKSVKKKKYFLFCGMNHPIKNVDFLLDSYRKLVKDKNLSDYELILVGNFPKKRSDKGVKIVNNISREFLRTLYQEATAYVTASKYESFNIPVLESLSQNTQVIGLSSAIIPELKEYVNIADGQRSFVKCMKKIARGYKKKFNHQKLVRDFSWQNYVKKLVAAYK